MRIYNLCIIYFEALTNFQQIYVKESAINLYKTCGIFKYTSLCMLFRWLNLGTDVI